MVTSLLLVIGGLNWLLVGIFKWDVGMLFGGSMIYSYYLRARWVVCNLRARYA
jgi:uncharacterized membrane protein YuzA (DUF378 family)